MTLAQPDSTLTAIRLKVRRLTASSSEQSLSTDIIDQAINTFYQSDFPYAIKLDQMRSVYEFFTIPNVEKYPLNVNFNQGIRAPVYFEGLRGYFYKNRDEFYSVFPRNPSLSHPFVGDGATQQFNFTVAPIPFLSESFVLSCVDTNGNQIIVKDSQELNGAGSIPQVGFLFYQHANGIVPQPSIVNPTPPPEFLYTQLPGMTNNNLSGTVSYQAQQYQAYPGDKLQTLVGSVNYVTGVVSIDFTNAGVTPANGSQSNLWVAPYRVGRPYHLLFWNNEFTVRPVPDTTVKIEVETYLTPVQFLETSDYPIINQWWQYIAYGAAMEILRERQDVEGVENLREGFMRQEAMVLERQATEEIGQRNSTIFAGSSPNQGNQLGSWNYW
jgi:hypothetical protein